MTTRKKVHEMYCHFSVRMVILIYLFICGLFTDDVSSLHYTVLKSRMISSSYIALNSEQQVLKNSKGMVTGTFEIPLTRGTRENQEKSQVRITVSPAKIKKWMPLHICMKLTRVVLNITKNVYTKLQGKIIVNPAFIHTHCCMTTSIKIFRNAKC